MLSSKPSPELWESNCVFLGCFPSWHNKGTFLDGALIFMDIARHYPVVEIFLDSSWVENILLMF